MAISTLLVDDSDDVRAMLRIAMRARGDFEVAGEAGSGAEALELARELRPEVVVLDLGLPDLEGRDLLDRIREQSPASRIVVFTGRDIDRAWFEQQGAGFVVKGEGLDHLLDVIQEARSDQDYYQSLEIPLSLGRLRQARRFVIHVLRHWGFSHLETDAVIVVSELVANAFEHAQSPCCVTVRRTRTGVQIEVKDDGPGSPDPQRIDVSNERGRGLRIVAELSVAWGVRTEKGSKVVWAELSHDR